MEFAEVVLTPMGFCFLSFFNVFELLCLFEKNSGFIVKTFVGDMIYYLKTKNIDKIPN